MDGNVLSLTACVVTCILPVEAFVIGIKNCFDQQELWQLHLCIIDSLIFAVQWSP